VTQSIVIAAICLQCPNMSHAMKMELESYGVQFFLKAEYHIELVVRLAQRPRCILKKPVLKLKLVVTN